MKLKKFSVLIAALLCASMLLMACAKEEPTPAPDNTPTEEPSTTPDAEGPHLLDGLYNSDYAYAPGKLTSVSKIEGMSGKIKDSCNYLAWIQESDTVSKIYNVTTKTVLLTLTDTTETVDTPTSKTITTKHYVRFLDNVNLWAGGFTVLTVTTDSTMPTSPTYNIQPFSYSDSDKVSRSAAFQLDFYDGTGTLLKTLDKETIAKGIQKNTPSDSYAFRNYYDKTVDFMYSEDCTDLIFIDRTAYRVNDDCSMTLVKEYSSLQVMPSIYLQVGDYYYDWSYDYQNTHITIYDRQLTRVVHYNINRSYTYDYPGIFVLNNGNVLIQYLSVLPNDATEYDVYAFESGSSSSVSFQKYDLNTLIISPNGTVTPIEVNYILWEVYPISSKLYGPQDENYFNDSVENIAYLHYIENKQYDEYSVSTFDTVSLSNDGTILQSFKIRNDAKYEYFYIGSGIYTLHTIYDEILVLDRDGNVLSSFDYQLNYSWIDDLHYCCGSAIYSVNGEKVYDFTEHDIADIHIFSYTAILESETAEDGSKTYYLFNNGTVSTIGTVGGANATCEDFCYDTYDGVYYFKDKTTNKYMYYNEMGTLIAEMDQKISYVMGYDNGIIYADADNNLYLLSYDGPIY